MTDNTAIGLKRTEWFNGGVAVKPKANNMCMCVWGHQRANETGAQEECAISHAPEA